MEVRTITTDWEFLVLACDGIWDVMNNKEVIDFCRKRIGQGMYPEEICEELMNNCLAPDCQMGGLGGDNMTVVLVCFLHNKPYTDLVKRCTASSADDNDIVVAAFSNKNVNKSSAVTANAAISPISLQQQQSIPSISSLIFKDVDGDINHILDEGDEEEDDDHEAVIPNDRNNNRHSDDVQIVLDMDGDVEMPLTNSSTPSESVQSTKAPAARQVPTMNVDGE